jgi:hypothetical protein
MLSPSTFIGPFATTDKVLVLRDVKGKRTSGFNVCHYQKSMVEGKQLWLTLEQLKLVLEFQTETEANTAMVVLTNVIETLRPNCVINGGTIIIQDANYTHSQNVLSNNWVISHNLGKFPSVTIIENNGDLVFGEINYIDAQTIILSFSHNIAGKAYLN